MLVDEARYPRKAVRILVEHGLHDETTNYHWRDMPGYQDLRAYVERTGDLESGGIAVVMDIDRALTRLGARHPDAAIIVATVMLLGFDWNEITEVIGGRRNWAKVQTKAIAWMACALSGGDDEACEKAWKHARD